MKSVLISLLACAATASLAYADPAVRSSDGMPLDNPTAQGTAGPVKLSDQQLDQTVAGHCSEANPGSALVPHGQGAIFCSLFEHGHPIFIMTGHNGTGQIVFPH